MAQNYGAFKITAPSSGPLTVTMSQPSGYPPTLYSDAAVTTVLAQPVTVAAGATQLVYLANPNLITLSVTFGSVQVADPLQQSTQVVDVSAGQVVVRDYSALKPTIADSVLITANNVGTTALRTRTIQAPVLGSYQVFQGISNGTDIGCNTMMKRVLPAGYSLNTFALGYSNHNSTGSGENDGANTITVVAAVGLTTTGPWFDLTKDGQKSMTINGGADLDTDPITLSVPAGGTFYEKVFVTPSASGVWSSTGTIGVIGTTYWCSHSGGETDLHLSTASFTPATGTKPYAATRIVNLAHPPTVPSVEVVGDSIAGGQGDLITTNGGWSYAALNGVMPYCRIAVSGSKLQNMIDPNLGRRRSNQTRGCTVTIDAYGINDLTSGRTLAQIQADALTLWFSRFNMGRKVFATTRGPVTTSTDEWITLANQSTVASNAVRILLNNWIRDGAPILNGVAVAAGSSAAGTIRIPAAAHPLTGYFEFADVVESARDSGKWAVHPRARQLTDFSTTLSTANSIVSATANFTSADVGLGINIAGSITSNVCAILSVQSATQCTVNNGALVTATVSGATGQVGAYWPTIDGTHPQQPNHASIAAVVTPAVLNAAVAF